MFLFHCWFCFISDDSVCYCCCSFGIFVERLLLLLVLFLYQSVFAIFTRLTFFAIFVNRCIAVSNVCISFDTQPRLYLHTCTPFVSYFIANEGGRKKFAIFLIASFRYIPIGKLSIRIAVIQIVYGQCSRRRRRCLGFLFCFYHLFCRSACFFHDCIIRKMLCCSHTKRIPSRCSLFSRFVLLFHILKT